MSVSAPDNHVSATAGVTANSSELELGELSADAQGHEVVHIVPGAHNDLQTGDADGQVNSEQDEHADGEGEAQGGANSSSDSEGSDSEHDDLPASVTTHTPAHAVDTSAAAKNDSTWTARDDKPEIPAFTAKSGPTTVPPPNASPLYFLKLFFTATFWQLLVTETNRYAQQYLQKNKDSLPPQARARSWKPVTIPDMKVFIALYLLTGLVFKPQIHLYWSTDPLLSTPAFNSAMTSRRYKLILQFLHFTNNEAAPQNGDKLRKVRPLMDILITNFKSAYMPTKQISVDEELVLFKGRLGFKQYIPNKRSRFGIKIYALCDSTGYYWNACVYDGKPNPPLPLTNQLGQSGAVTVHLLSTLANQGYHLYLDNFYTSISLAEHMRTKLNTCICGTMRANRVGIPSVLKNMDVAKGKYAYRRKGNVLVLKLHDKKVIFLLSTLHNTEQVVTRKRTRHNQQIKRLKVNHDYNTYMGGVDKNDMMVGVYSALRKTYKWYMKLAFHLIEEAVQNGYILYKQQPGNKLRHHEYLREVVQALLQEADAEKAETLDIQHRLVGKHFLEHVPATTNKAKPTKRCVVCAPGKRSESRYQCQTCQNHPGLCVVPCFQLYHTKAHYH